MAKSSKKLKIGHVQDTPVSISMISNECMMCHMKVHIVSYNLDQKKNFKIHTLPNYEQMDLKTAIVCSALWLFIFYKNLLLQNVFQITILAYFLLEEAGQPVINAWSFYMFQNVLCPSKNWYTFCAHFMPHQKIISV